MTKISYSTLPSVSDKRAQLKKQLDDFATFMWRDVEMYDTFGAFIINEKGGSLKLYNGANFSNDYSKPAYQSSHGSLMGVNFSIQTISFKIGVYYFTEEEYRRFIYFLNPYEISDLVFDFDKNYRYLVKLTGREDSIRYPQGRDENGDQRYYTEMNLKFEIQGEPVARASLPYEFKCEHDKDSNVWIQTFKQTTDSGKALETYKISDLDTPIELSIPFEIKSKDPIDKLQFIYTSEYKYNDGTKIATATKELFNVSLKNLTWYVTDRTKREGTDSNEPTSNIEYELSYDSEAGLLYFTANDETKLLTLLTATYSGEPIVDTISVSKFKILGKYDTPNINYENIKFKLEVIGVNSDGYTIKDPLLLSYAITTLV